MRGTGVIWKLYFAFFLLAVGIVFLNFRNLPKPTAKTEKKLPTKDWHDYAAMERDRKRVGLGELGLEAFIDHESLREEERKIYFQFGYNGLLSEMISVNRSIRDIRHKKCKKLKYLASLPTVSVVIPFFDEHLSVILRSIHSVINRSPRELLREIILVDDGGYRTDILDKLRKYVSEKFSIVQIIRLEERVGLIGARLAGARRATSEVLVFLDSHIETNYNWLPPLLEPIAMNKRTVVCPFIDVIDHKTFEYSAQDEGGRGGFNWAFDYKRLPVLPQNRIDRTTPFESPVMAGGLFAISAEFFWELGGYDEGLRIWGGEQYELSFKIWMCGGTLLDAPCSRVGHIYRGETNGDAPAPIGDYVRRNYKRVAEVWMDEYKEYLYDHDKEFSKIDPGDLSAQKALRNRLKCRPFKWFMETIAFDVLQTYPPIEPPDYANGAIQSVAQPTLCVDTLDDEGAAERSRVGLFLCASDLLNPHRNQNWALSAHRDIRLRSEFSCLTVKSDERNAEVLLETCLEEGHQQFWYFDRKRQWIVLGSDGERCLEAQPESERVVVNDCSTSEENMKWRFGFVNETAMDTFFINIPEGF